MCLDCPRGGWPVCPCVVDDGKNDTAWVRDTKIATMHMAEWRL